MHIFNDNLYTFKYFDRKYQFATQLKNWMNDNKNAMVF